jgi:hypothetical protein
MGLDTPLTSVANDITLHKTFALRRECFEVCSDCHRYGSAMLNTTVPRYLQKTAFVNLICLFYKNFTSSTVRLQRTGVIR